MVSGRKALLEKAREFGSLARDLFLDEILARSVTFRAIARHLGIEDIWWSEFWRSFYSPNERETLHGFCFCGKADDVLYFLGCLSDYFGKYTLVASISRKEFDTVCRIAARAKSRLLDIGGEDEGQPLLELRAAGRMPKSFPKWPTETTE